MVIAILIVEYSVNRQAVMKPKTKEDFERDVKFSAFKKTDAFIHEQIVGRLVLYAMTPFIPFKLCLGWGAATFMSCTVKVFTLLGGDDPGAYTPF